ncbi:hypothetical protein NRS6167_21120 [Bacillus subtilis]|nr:hypothetical protein NRS6167_00781 [Bacillus subtilis]CAI6325351.1 hypothetical protein NRS6167_21120 [Bacillus subtilis]
MKMALKILQKREGFLLSERNIFKADYLENAPALQQTGIFEEKPILASISSTCYFVH